MNASDWMTFDRTGFDIARLLLSALWQSSILLAAAWLIARLLRGRHAAIRHAIVAAAVLASPLVPLVGLALSRAGAPQAQIAVMPAYEPAPLTQTVVTYRPVQTDIAPAPAAAPAALAERFSLRSYPWAVALAAYAAGVIVLLSLITVARRRIGRWVRRGHIVTEPRILELFAAAQKHLRLPGRIMVVESPQCLSPMTAGSLSPVILLPGGLAEQSSDADLTAIALHELAHIRRRDSLLLLLLSLVRAVFFFHPLIWLACRQAARLAETACDDAVLEVTGQPIGYAKMLVRLAEQMPRRAPVIEMAAGIVWSKSAFIRRVEIILSDRRSQIRRLSRLGLAVTVLLAGLSMLLAQALPLAERDRSKQIVGRLLDPNGKGVGGVEVFVATPKRHISIVNGKSGLPDTVSMLTDSKGRFWVRPQGSSFSVYVFDARGYAAAEQQQLEQNQPLRLQPWARASGRVILAGKPLAGATVDTGARRLVGDCMALYSLETTTDPNGRYELTRLPPGPISIGRRIHLEKGFTAVNAQDHGSQLVLEAGQNVEANIGGSGHAITGRLLDPDGRPFQADNYWVEAKLLAKAANAKGVPLPAEFAAMTPQQKQDWRIQWSKTKDGRIYADQGAPLIFYYLDVGADGSFRVEDVPPGDYMLVILVNRLLRQPPWGMGELLWGLSDLVAVGEQPLDTGEFTLREASAPTQDQPATQQNATQPASRPAAGEDQGEFTVTSTIVNGRIVDKTDYPFRDDPAVIGRWTSVDFVPQIASFKPGHKQFRGDLFLKDLTFLPKGRMAQTWYTWTKGLVLHSGDTTGSHYTIQRIDGTDYLFFEWKSGDYSLLHRKPSYYVLKKEAGTAAEPLTTRPAASTQGAAGDQGIARGTKSLALAGQVKEPVGP